jgi:cobalt/nickel transport system permease protein
VRKLQWQNGQRSKLCLRRSEALIPSFSLFYFLEVLMSKQERLALIISMAFAFAFWQADPVYAMHIMEGYLPLGHCVLWGAICIPFLVMGIVSIRRTVENNRKTLLILVMAGAFTFVLSALKLPSVTGSSSHATGTGLGAILFGPAAMCVIGIIVLLFQALLLAHGGLTTLGANTFSMAVVGPMAAYLIYTLCRKIGTPKSVGIFLAASIGDLLTYLVTAFQLALAHPAETGGFLVSFEEFLGIFAFTQIPLAIVEGILTVVVVKGLEAYAKPELTALGFLKDKNRGAD